MSADGSAHLETRTASPEQTEALAGRLAPLLPAGTVVGLIGPLGSGKTCFVRGLAAGLGLDPDAVASPTFVYLVDYGGPPGRLYHADLYRFADLPPDAAPQALEGIGLYAAMSEQAITVVEWWDHYRGPQPGCLVVVEFVIEKADDRSIMLEFVGPELADAARRFGAKGGPTS